MALAGPRLVPGAGADAPRWVLGVFGDGVGLAPGTFLGLMYAAIVAWVALLLAARGGGERVGRVLWALIWVLVAAFVLAPPLLSLDLFSYVSYGRLGVEGLNPYEHGPAALPGDAAAERVEDFRFAVSVYGPLFTVLSYPLAAVGVSFALWGLKAIAGAAVIAAAALTARIARLRGLPAAPAAAFVALNPLVLVHVVGGGHNDGLMVALALAGSLALLTARPLAAGVGLAAATAVKSAAGLYVPFALAGSWRLGRGFGRLLSALVGAALALALISLLLFGPDVSEALGVAGENQRTVSRWSVPGTIARATGLDADPLRYGLAALYVVGLLALLVWALRGADWVRAAGWAAAGLLVATSWMVPWYLIWLLPFAAVSRDRALLAVAVLLTAFQAINAVPV